MRLSGRLAPNWTSVCAHAVHDTATLDAISVDGNSLVGRSSGQALLATGESKRWRMSNAAPYQCEHLYTSLPCTSANLHRLCTNSDCIRLHTATHRYNHLDEPANCTGRTIEGTCRIFNITRTLHLTRNSHSANQSYTTRMLSACFWIFTINFKHMLTSVQYQVFQDLQGPASSLRVGSSVRTSTWPLSVSLLHLRLRYLTCIQRR